MINFDVLSRDVWEDNFDEEMCIIRNQVITNFPIVSLATCLRPDSDRVPIGVAWGDSAANYAALLQATNNMEVEKLTQIALAFSDRQGQLLCCGDNGRPCLWEFNLMLPNEEADLPKGSSGTAGRAKKAVNPWRLAADLWRCKLLMNENVIWVVFKGGLDFVALLRWVRFSAQGLPPELDEFLRLQRLYFPVCYDIGAALGFHHVLGDDGTITVMARKLGVRMQEIPTTPPASDSLLALRLFATLMCLPLGTIMLKNKRNVIFGITAGEEADYALPKLSIMPELVDG